MENTMGKRFPVSANDYKQYGEVGEGVSATVYRVLCIPLNEIVAIKVLDLEKCNSDLQEYRRGISAWNFNIEDLKNQAALIQDYDGVFNAENQEVSEKKMHEFNNSGYPSERPSSEGVNHSTAISIHQESFNDITDLESSLPSFPIKPLEALREEKSSIQSTPGLGGLFQCGFVESVEYPDTSFEVVAFCPGMIVRLESHFSTGCLLEELQQQKMKNAQLERQLNSKFSSKERQ